MRRPTFARLAAAMRRKPVPGGSALRGGKTDPVGSAGKDGSPPRRSPSRPEAAPSWHELVLPGPKGSPRRREERLARSAERLGELRAVKSKPTRARKDQTPNGAPRAIVRRASREQGFEEAGRFVAHQHKPARPSGRALASPTSRRGRAQRAAQPQK